MKKPPKLKDLRFFGLMWSLIFVGIGLEPLLGHRPIVAWPFGIAAAFLFVALAMPAYLLAVYTLWMKFASVMGKINSRIILTLMFVFLVTPIGTVMRWLGHDPLRRKRHASIETYWIERTEQPSSMKYQG